MRFVSAACRPVAAAGLLFAAASPAASEPGVGVLLVDTDRVLGPVDEAIYGHFLEHINHSVVDGLFAEQIRGQGFEAKDLETYWEPFATGGGSFRTPSPASGATPRPSWRSLRRDAGLSSSTTSR